MTWVIFQYQETPEIYVKNIIMWLEPLYCW